MMAFQDHGLGDVEFRITLVSLRPCTLFIILWLCRRGIFRPERSDTKGMEGGTNQCSWYYSSSYIPIRNSDLAVKTFDI
jgi:hypothetical protein